MFEIKNAENILDINENATLEEIEKVFKNLIELITSDISDEYTDFICDYLVSMKTVFNERYKTNKMTSEEYQIWKTCLEDDFNEIPLEIKNKIKYLILQKVIKILKEKSINNKYNASKEINIRDDKYLKISDYNNYIIDEFKTINYTNIRINYSPKIKKLLWFSVIIIVLNIFFSFTSHYVESIQDTAPDVEQQETNTNNQNNKTTDFNSELSG